MLNDSNPAGRGARVLVIDDDPNLRYVMTSVLADEGFVIVSAADGRQALERAEQHTPDLVVLDVNLPYLSGQEFAAQLRERQGAAIPILVITADGRAAAKALEIGAYAYLRKPFELADLVATVRRGFLHSET